MKIQTRISILYRTLYDERKAEKPGHSWYYDQFLFVMKHVVIIYIAITIIIKNKILLCKKRTAVTK